MSTFEVNGIVRRKSEKERALRGLKTGLLCGAVLSAAGVAAPVYAQKSAQPAVASVSEEIVVTGTRIVRDGFESPTPLTVLNTDQILANAPTNIADYVGKLPAFANSQTARTSSTSVSDGNGGVSNLNLRALGASRTLVLLDGVRIVPSSVTGFNRQGGSVDTNSFPSQLISRIDVITGGASAAYGSDALAGVVNFVLDKTFTGVKGEVVGGVTTYGDDRQYLVNLTGGTPFAGGRGHFLISGEISHVDGIPHGKVRGWLRQGWDQIPNPAYTATNGQPFYVVVKQVGSGLFTPGGLISSGPLKGIDFGPGGSTRAFTYGIVNAGSANMIGGDWEETVGALTDSAEGYTSSLDVRVSRQNLFSRASYQVTDDFEVYAQYMFANTDSLGYCCASSQTLTINSGNPFIPSSVQSQMTALGLTSFQLGKWNADQGPSGASNNRRLAMYAVGATGAFDMAETSWSWNLDASRSLSWTKAQAVNNPIRANVVNAANVVTNPANGQPICASTLSNPGNGCVPYNPMGVGMNSPQAIAYAIGGQGQLNQVLRQNEFLATLRGEPFSIWAGPVSLATGFEHRKLSVTGKSTPLDEANAYFLGNYHPTIGSYKISEVFAESVVPLAKDAGWARQLDLNLAVRGTSYSTSGEVVTWKAGLTYDTPIEGLRIRATRSRDIRAPNLGELFSQGQSGQGSILDATRGNVTVPNILTNNIGNSALEPEAANTTGLGAVYQPEWFPGFSMSLDYFKIDVNNAIGSISAQNEVNQCALGNLAYCSFIQRDAAGNIQIVFVKPANTSYAKERGFDFEASYRAPLSAIVDDWDGEIALRFLATHIWNYTTVDPTGLVTPAAGVNGGGGVPKWRYHITANYELDPVTVSWTGRGISAGVRSRLFTECQSGCPASNPPYYTTSDNRLPAAFYMDMNVTYHLPPGDYGSQDLFVSIENLTNNNPKFFAGVNSALYEMLGRVFRAGLRFRM